MTDNVDDGRYEIEPVSNIQPHTSPEEATTRWCEPCAYECDRRTEAVSYCPTCNALFCKACDDAHTRLPSSRHHEVIRGSEMPDSNADKPVKYPDCKIHPENHKDNYCATHGNIVCRLCAKKQHDKKCLIKSISDLCTEMGDCDIDNLKEDVNTVRDLVTDTTLTLDKNVNEIKLQNETLVQEVDEFRTNIVSKLDDLFSEMKSRINEHCAQQCLKHLQNMSFLSDVTDSLDQTLAEIDKVAKYTVEEHLFLRMQEIIEKMYRLSKNVDESIKQMQIVHLSFSPNKALVSFASSLSSLGDVKTEQMHSTSRPLPVANFPRLQLNIKPKSVKKLTSLNVKIPEDQYTCNIKGMAARNDGSLILPDYDNKRVKFLSSDHKLTASLTLPASPTDVCVIKNRMAVVPTNAKTLHFIDISNPESIPVQFARPVNLEYTVWSCASYKDDLVVTAATKPRSVKLIDTFGKEKWSLSTDSSGQPLFGWPGSVVCKTVKGKSVVTVADPGKDELILIDIKKGEVIRILPLENKGPRSLTIDNAGNMYAGCNDTREIVVWKPNLDERGTCIPKLFLNPDVSRVFYNKITGHLFVAYEEKDKLDVFTILY